MTAATLYLKLNQNKHHSNPTKTNSSIDNCSVLNSGYQAAKDVSGYQAAKDVYGYQAAKDVLIRSNCPNHE